MCGLIGLHLVVNLTREIVLSLVFYMLTVKALIEVFYRYGYLCILMRKTLLI